LPEGDPSVTLSRNVATKRNQGERQSAPSRRIAEAAPVVQPEGKQSGNPHHRAALWRTDAPALGSASVRRQTREHCTFKKEAETKKKARENKERKA
jgi:hypothetical protein